MGGKTTMASYRKKGSGWNFRASYKEDGKYKTKEQGGFVTKKEAQLAAAEFEKSVANGDAFKNKEKIFAEYYENWFKTFKENKFSEETNKNYKSAIKQVKLFFKNKKLKDITRPLYQEFINNYAETHSIETVRKLNKLVSSCLKDAVQDGDLSRLPSYRVTISGTESKKESEKYLDELELKKLIISVEKNLKVNYTSSYMILLAIASGARFSELLGLTEDCIDFVNHTIKIDKTWDYKHSKDFAKTKTESSMRTLAIDKKTMNHLKDFIEAKKIKPINKLVFTDEKLSPISSTAVNKSLKRALIRAEIHSNVTFHSLRHTHASVLLLHDTSLLYVSKRLGHSSMDTTANVYSHLVKELNEKGNKISEEIMDHLYA